MLKISGTTITLTRGDTLRVNLGLTMEDGQPFVLEEGCQIGFAVKKDYDDDQALYSGSVDPEDLQLVMPSAETQKLGIGTYVYDVELTKANEDVETFLSGKLKIVGDVYRRD